MTIRLIENIFEAEAMAEEMRNKPVVFFVTDIPKELLRGLETVRPGAIIMVPCGYHWQAHIESYAIPF